MSNPMDDPEFMQAMMKFMTPGDAHKQLAARVGTWNVHATMHMAPGAPEMVMESVASAEMILGGRYLVESVKGSFMGQPFEGQNTLGFNNSTEEWFSIWIDNMGTGFASAAGKAREDGTVSMAGSMVDAVSPEGRPYRAVTHPLNDKGQLVVDMYDTLPDGTEWAVMQMTYTRAE